MRRSRRESKLEVDTLPEPSFQTVLLNWMKPVTRFAGKKRWNKVAVTEQVTKYLAQYKVKGSYIGLGGSYIPEIYDCLSPYITGQMVSCERDKKSIESLTEYTQLISQVYDSSIFSLRAGDIFDILKTEQTKYSIIDLDLMELLETECHPLKEKVGKIVDSLETCTTNRFCLIVWSLIGFKRITEERYNNYIRPVLGQSLNKKYRLLARYCAKYRDTCPIKVDLFILSRRTKQRKQRIETNELSTTSSTDQEGTPGT